jgi:hypothetical protein
MIQEAYDNYAASIAYLTKYTLVELREIAKRMDVAGRSTAKKGALVHLIAADILGWMDEALEMNETYRDDYIVPGTDIVLNGKSGQVMRYHMENVKRFNPLLRRDKDGIVVLTAKQRRRVPKKIRAFAKKIGL